MKPLIMDNRLSWWLLIAYFSATPFIPLFGFPISWTGITLMDWQRLIEFGSLSMALLWLLNCVSGRLGLPTKQLLAWCVFFVLGFISAIVVAKHVDFALLEWSWTLMIIVFIGLMRSWQSYDKKALEHLILISVMISTLVYLWWFWQLNASIYFEPLPDGITRRLNFPGFSNVRFFSDYQSFIILLLPVAIHRLIAEGPIRTLAVALGGLYFSIALIAGSRSLVIAHLAIHLGLTLYLGKLYLPYLKMQLKFWCIAILCFLLLTELLPQLINNNSHELVFNSLMRADSNHRTVLWEKGLQLIIAHPLLGVGPMHFADFPNRIASSTHNVPMQYAAEWGLPAAVLICALGLMHILPRISWFKHESINADHGIELAITCATIAIFLQSMVACSPVGYPVGQVIAIICLAYPLPMVQASTPRVEFSAWPIKIVGYGAILLLAFSMTSSDGIKERNLCFHNAPWPTKEYAPHFWQQGWLFDPCGKSDSILSRFIES